MSANGGKFKQKGDGDNGDDEKEADEDNEGDSKIWFSSWKRSLSEIVYNNGSSWMHLEQTNGNLFSIEESITSKVQ